MKKKGAVVFFFFLVLGVSLEAQQITRFAVVDLPRVYTAFFRDSRAVRDFEERSSRVQAEINRMTAEIQTLQSSRVDAEAKGDRDQALRLETEISRKSDLLRDYYQTKTAELEAQRNRLTQSGSFLEQVYAEIRRIAESEGYSMVLNLKENTGILWYSPTVDITDKLIQNLMTRAGR